mgnify:FL=1
MECKKKIDRDSNVWLELLRFVIIGGYATVLDMAVEGWVTSAFSGKTAGANHIGAFFWMFLFSLVGFLLATPANWSLSSVWGFRSVDAESEKKAKSIRGMLLFAFWSFVALLIGALIQFIGYMTCLEWTGWNINILSGFSFDKMFGENGSIAVFWAWLVVFVIRTAVTLVVNYVSRKLFIYKAPKNQ